MNTVSRTGDDRLDVIVSEKLDADGATQLIDAMIKHAEGIENGRMFIDIEEFEMPTLGALKIELSRLPEAIRFTRQFSRVAVLSGETWVNAISSLESKLIPGLVIKSFRRDQRYQAESWLQSDT